MTEIAQLVVRSQDEIAERILTNFRNPSYNDNHEKSLMLYLLDKDHLAQMIGTKEDDDAVDQFNDVTAPQMQEEGASDEDVIAAMQAAFTNSKPLRHTAELDNLPDQITTAEDFTEKAIPPLYQLREMPPMLYSIVAPGAEEYISGLHWLFGWEGEPEIENLINALEPYAES